MNYVVSIFYHGEGGFELLTPGNKLSIGSKNTDNMQFSGLKSSQYSLSLNGDTPVLQYGLLKKQILRAEEINTVEDNREMAIYLRKERGGENKYRITLQEKEPVFFGRGAEAQLRVANPCLSRKHMELTLMPGGILRVRDMGSTHGVYKDNKKRNEFEVRKGERFYVLNMRFLFDGSCVYLQNIFDPFSNNVVIRQKAVMPAYFPLSRPQGVDVSLSRIGDMGIELRPFMGNTLLHYKQPIEKLSLKIFETKMAPEMIQPRPFKLNGHEAMLFVTKDLKELKEILTMATLSELIRIYRSFFERFYTFLDNRDIEIQHMMLMPEMLFVDVISMEVFFIYVPFIEMVPQTYDNYLNAVRWQMSELLGRLFLSSEWEREVSDKIQKILTNANIPFSGIGNALNILLESGAAKSGDDDTPLFERVTNGTVSERLWR